MKVKEIAQKLPSYMGGKSGNGTYQNIINHIPPHKIYVAPFAGHDGIFQKKLPATISILNDKDATVIDRWKTAIDRKRYQVCENFMQGNLFEAPKLPVVILRNDDYKTIVARFTDNTDAFIYFDPPYKMETRRSKKNQYTFDFHTDSEHMELLQLATLANCNVMISAYENDLYNEQLQGWQTHRFNSMTRAGLREEIIYFNYATPTVLHDFRYLGTDFRERERIKRKVARHSARLLKMPVQERSAILSAIINDHLATTKTIIAV